MDDCLCVCVYVGRWLGPGWPWAKVQLLLTEHIVKGKTQAVEVNVDFFMI